MIIPDLKEHVRNKGTTEYRTLLMAAVQYEITRLQSAIDGHERKHATSKANNAKRLLMTIFALLEQIPWVGMDAVNKGQGIEQRAKDTMLVQEEQPDA